MNNLSITGSFIIGGFVLLTLLYVYYKFSARQQDMAVCNYSQTCLAGINRVLDYDFDKLGYRVTSGTKLSSIDTFSVSFRADLDNNGIIDSVTYYRMIDSTGKHMVRRTIESSSKEWEVAVYEFKVEGFDSIGSLSYNVSNIKSIAVTIVLDHCRMVTDSTANIGCYWKKRYFPKNL
jgi:hypothetical protein